MESRIKRRAQKREKQKSRNASIEEQEWRKISLVTPPLPSSFISEKTIKGLKKGIVEIADLVIVNKAD
ncbi:10547_t:CDS:1, partial [Ambispora leptoticha]